jgi:hypothetical protein
MRLVAIALLLVLAWTPGIARAKAVPDAMTWVPSYVSVESGQNPDGSRYVSMTFAWSDVSGFAAHSTYEQDFLLDNYDASPLGPGTYLDRSRRLDQTPTLIYWTSDLPAAYLDTRLGDGNDEIAYSIGSGNAAAIRPNVRYTTVIEAKPGDAERDSARLSAQLGHQKPAGCESTWCSFDDTSVDIFPAWTIPVPGKVTTGTPPPAS